MQPSWINFSGGDTFHSVAVAGSVVYVGGHNRWVNNECGSNVVCEWNTVLVDGLAALDASTGLALPWWHPQTSRGVGVQSLTTFPAGLYPGSNGGLLLGTDVNIIGGAYHSNLAMFPLASAATPTPGGPIPSGIFSQGRLHGANQQNSGVPAMCVDDATNNSAAGSPVQLSTCANTAEQSWTVEPGGTIRINGLCLDTASAGTAPGTPTVVNPCVGVSTQVWTQGPGQALVNQASGLCLDTAGGGTAAGTLTVVNPCDGAGTQVWTQGAGNPGSAGNSLMNQGAPGMCLADPGSVTANNTQLQISACQNGLAAETWVLPRT